MVIDHIAYWPHRRRWAPLRHAASWTGKGFLFRIVCYDRLVSRGWSFVEMTKAQSMRWGITCEACKKALEATVKNPNFHSTAADGRGHD